MRAIRHDRFGGYDVLDLVDSDRPSPPGAGQQPSRRGLRHCCRRWPPRTSSPGTAPAAGRPRAPRLDPGLEASPPTLAFGGFSRDHGPVRKFLGVLCSALGVPVGTMMLVLGIREFRAGASVMWAILGVLIFLSSVYVLVRDVRDLRN
jgi:hypothetical protein